jgi:diguanylate cyclase (GGDEF)-like protein
MGERPKVERRKRTRQRPAWLTDPVRWVRQWPVWQLQRRVLFYVLCIEAIAILAATYTGLLYPVTQADWTRVGILAACAVVHIEATRRIERQREIAAGAGPYLDLKSVWNFAALLLLPPALATGMVVFTYAYAWFRIWPQKQSVSLYRWIYSGATVVLATQVAVPVLVVGIPGYPNLPSGLGGIAVVAAVGAVRWLINYTLVLLVLALSQPALTARELLANFKDQIMEAGAVAFGFCTAALLVFQPVYVIAPVVALLAMQRTVLVTQFERAAQIDAKTGLYNSGWWRKHADRVLARAQTTGTQVGVLMADLDHFKAINDTYGHPAGDDVLVAVAGAMSGQVRGDLDIVGRFGGEEFAILIPEITERELLATAERIRLYVAAMGVVVQGDDGPIETVRVTVSIGAAIFPRDGGDLGELTLRADSALYEAKKGGRNQVRLYGEPVVTPAT